MAIGLHIGLETGWLTWCFNWSNVSPPSFGVRPTFLNDYDIE